jgi:hypothetical protein
MAGAQRATIRANNAALRAKWESLPRWHRALLGPLLASIVLVVAMVIPLP